MSGIYVHIPFCKRACHYCDFHFSTSLKYQKKTINSINKEIEIRKNYLNKEIIQSIYIGGGTPSLIDVSEVEKIIKKIFKEHKTKKEIEITIEANPDDITKNKLSEYMKIGINRISLGVQSFYDKHLIYSNRSHNSKQAIKSIELILESGFDNFSVDLIYGFPNMTKKEWEKNLNFILKYKVPHISAYCLTIEKNTVFEKYIKNRQMTELEQEYQKDMFLLLMKKLQNNNYKQYEISNFCLKNYKSLHNSNYWEQKKYMGVGPSAHSYNKYSRQWNVSNNLKYIKSIEKNIIPFESEILSEEDKINEYMLTSIRTNKGLSIKFIQENFNQELNDHFVKKIKKIPRNYIKIENDHLILTKKGKCFADKITRDLFYLN